MLRKLKIKRSSRISVNLIIGTVIVVLILLFAVISPLFINANNARVGAVPPSQPPSRELPLGSDSHGRDILASLSLAVPATMKVGVIAGLVSVTLGLTLGLLAGFFSGWPDWTVRTFSDVLLAVPVVSFLVLIIGRMEKPNIIIMSIVIGFLTWSGTARSIRAQVLSIRERSYTAVARANGESELEVLFAEIMPNLIPLLMACFIGAVTAGIYSVMSLEILGLGQKNTPTLGMMIFFAQRMSAVLRGLWWSWSPPIAAIALIFIGLFLISSGLDKYVNPTQSRMIRSRNTKSNKNRRARNNNHLKPNTNSEYLLEVKNLSVVYETDAGNLTAVDNVSFAIKPGQRMGLIGESGSGKSTLATAIMNLSIPPARIANGEVLLEGVDLLQLSDAELRQRRMREIVLIPQAAMNVLNPVLQIGTQIKDTVLAHDRTINQKQLEQKVKNVLIKVGLRPEIAKRFPHQLSGGMKQRTIMSIGISLSPKLIVADEPTSALDVVVQHQIMSTLAQLQKELNAAVLLIGHDMGLVSQFCDVIGVLYAGSLVERADSDSLLENPFHPYTRMLIDSLPSLDRRHELISIPGLPPELMNLPTGCSFHPRCPLAFDRCKVEKPLLQRVGSNRQVACHLYPEHKTLPSFKLTSAQTLNQDLEQ